MKCDNIDFITRNGHSDIFKHDVERVLDSIELGINSTPELISYSVIAIPRFNDDNSWYRIPCEDRTVYVRNCDTFWGNEYEIAYKSKLSVYGYLEKNGYYRVLRILYNEYIHTHISYTDLYNARNRWSDELVSLVHGA